MLAGQFIRVVNQLVVTESRFTRFTIVEAMVLSMGRQVQTRLRGIVLTLDTNGLTALC
jgi:hypothetical protein